MPMMGAQLPILTRLPKKLLRQRNLMTMLGVCRKTLYTRIKSDPSFPRPIRIGANRLAWPEEEIVAWLNAQRVA
jgi:prophage regulatory protein